MTTAVKREKLVEHNWWEDEEFVAELDRRIANLKSGKSKTYTWEEVQAAIKHLQEKRKYKKS